MKRIVRLFFSERVTGYLRKEIVTLAQEVTGTILHYG